MNEKLDEKLLVETIESNYKEAEEILKDVDKVEKFLERVEQRLKEIPVVGKTLGDVPLLISLIRAYIKKEYTDVPIGTILAVIAALLYLLNHFDLIPDFVPGAGHLDDVAVLTVALKMTHDDVEEYRNWKKNNGKQVI